MGARGLTFKDFNYRGDKLTVFNYRVESQEYTPANGLLFLINDKEAIMLHDAYYRLKRIKRYLSALFSPALPVFKALEIVVPYRVKI